MVREGAYPRVWNEWIAMLAMKPGEDAKELNRRRDLWLQCHSMKCLMRMLVPEYERACHASVGVSQAGWEKDRNPPEHSVAARLAAEQCMRERTMCCRGYIDLGVMFMSVIHEVQTECERWCGVAPEVTDVIRALREGVTDGEGAEVLPRLMGRYETEFGLTDPVEIMKGLGQGCLLSPSRAKLTLSMISGVVHKLCKGKTFTVAGQGSIICTFADDMLLTTNDVQTLQHAYEAAWMVANITGLKLQVKGKKKCAWSATYWLQDGTEKDVTGWEMRMPDGETVIPQLVGEETYKYLGSEMRTGWAEGASQKELRTKIKRKCRQLIGLIGRAPLLTEEQMNTAFSLALGSVIGYYGRACCLTWADCQEIESARVAALRARKFTNGTPRVIIYGRRDRAMQHEHAFSWAAAALCDQIDRALCGPKGSPARVAVEDALAETCARLGCRGVHPLEWQPEHLLDAKDGLSEELLIENYLRARIHLGMRGKLTAGGTEREGPLGVERWHMSPADRLRVGPLLWEVTRGGEWDSNGRRCTFSRALAAAGVATWLDVTDPATGNWRKWVDMQREFGFKDAQGRACDDYAKLKAELDADGWAVTRDKWRADISARATPQAPAEDWRAWRAREWNVKQVVAARRAPECRGGHEYLIDWEGDYARSWEPAVNLKGGAEMEEELHRARSQHMVPTSYHEWLTERAEGGDVNASRAARLALRQLRKPADASAGKGDWALAWRLFVSYSEAATSLDMSKPNAPDLCAEEATIKGWTCQDEWQTCFQGKKVTDMAASTGKEKWVVGLDASTEWEKERPADRRVTEDEVARRTQRDRGRRMEAEERGEQEYASDLPEGAAAFARMAWEEGQKGRVFKGRDDAGHELVRDRLLAKDPVTRLFMRYAGLEAEGGKVITTAGESVTVDRKGRKVLRGRKAVCESGLLMRVCLALHAAHKFTHAAATDGSKAEEPEKGEEAEPGAEEHMGRTAFGVWWGIKLFGTEVEGEQDVEATEQEVAAACGAAFEGGRLPNSWEVIDAELWAIFTVLRRVWLEARVRGETPEELKQKRVLILSDCKPALTQLETAWRVGSAQTLRRGDRAAMLEAICRLRAQLGIVVCVWVPSHVGITPNEMADAACKSHLKCDEIDETTRPIAAHVHARPHLNERRVRNGVWELADRKPFAEHRRRARGHVRRRLEAAVAPGRATAGATGDIWSDVGKKALQMQKPEQQNADGKKSTRKPTWEDVDAHNERVRVVLGMRVSDVCRHAGAPHEAEWQRVERSERRRGGGPAVRSGEWGCWACRAKHMQRARDTQQPMPEVMPKGTAKHAICGPCASADKTCRETMDYHVGRLQRMQLQSRVGPNGQQGGGARWAELLTKARRATTASKTGGIITAEDWIALQQLLASQVPEWEGPGKDAADVDRQLRDMQHTAAKQLNAVAQAAASGQRWMQQREDKREWLRLLMRLWREVVECEDRTIARRPQRWRVRQEADGSSGPREPPTGVLLSTLRELETNYSGDNGGSGVTGVSYFWMTRGRGERPVRVTNEVYFRRLRDKLRGLATWARVMREHRERLRRQQKARQRWGKAIEKVRKRVREERARGERDDAAAPSDVGANEGAGEAGPSEGRGAQRNGRMADGAYRVARQWTRHEERRVATRRMATKDGARVGIRLWWWLVEGAGCSAGPIEWRPRVGDG